MTVSKRKISPRQVPKQGPAEDEPKDPSSKKSRRPHSPLQNWPNFFRECGAGKNCEGDILSGIGSGGVSGQTQGPGMAGTVCKHPAGVFCPRFGRILCKLQYHQCCGDK